MSGVVQSVIPPHTHTHFSFGLGGWRRSFDRQREKLDTRTQQWTALYRLCIHRWGPAVPGPFHQDQAITASPPLLSTADRKLLAWRGGSGKEPAVDVSDRRKIEGKKIKMKAGWIEGKKAREDAEWSSRCRLRESVNVWSEARIMTGQGIW